jgi:outer membrane murein-binding lipoprotein Lpp
MKTLTRVALVFFAGLALAGCASTTAKIDSPKVPKLAWGEQPLSSRDYWLQREFDDKIDRAVGIR